LADLSQAVADYLTGQGHFTGPVDVRFLAAGEYNENYLARSGDGSVYVFRINHGSQLGLDRQIEYEFNVLQAVAPSGVTPEPHFVDPEPIGLPGGALLMDYLPGAPLDYRRDLDKAAAIFARIHALAPVEGLVVQKNPVADIAAESLGLIQRHPDHPMTDVRDRLLNYHQTVLDLFEQTRELFESEPLVIVNTEVNSGNFLISESGAYLVDWEKAVVSQRYQDLGHFLVPTTTLWKTDVILQPEEKRRFLSFYRKELEARTGRAAPDLTDLVRKTDILEQTILLRALSWCFMAYYEYTQTNRTIRNEDTFAKIRQYLDDIECFLK
jgi:thiamine kinase-like enzyme